MPPHKPSTALLHAYDQLATLLLADDSPLLASIVLTLSAQEMNFFATALVDIAARHNSERMLFQNLIQAEVNHTQSAGTLFRTNSLASKAMTHYTHYPFGLTYLRSILGSFIEDIADGHYGSLEVNPQNADPDVDVAKNAKVLTELIRKAVDAIVGSSSELPVEIRDLCIDLRRICTEKFPDSSLTSVAGLLVLRCISPAIVTPEQCSLVSECPPIEARRTLVMVSKVVQNLANHVAFREGYMATFNPFLEVNQPRMDSFLDCVSQGTPGSSTHSTSAKPATEIITEAQYVASAQTVVDILIARGRTVAMNLPDTMSKVQRDQFIENMNNIASTATQNNGASFSPGYFKSSGGQSDSKKEAAQSSAPGGSTARGGKGLRFGIFGGESHGTSTRSEKEEQKQLEKDQKQWRKLEERYDNDIARGKMAVVTDELQSLRQRFLPLISRQINECIIRGDLEVLEEILKQSRQFANVRDREQQTPLMHASTCGSLGAVQLLLRYNADPFLTDNRGWTALHCSTSGNFPLITLELCRSKKVDVVATNHDGNTPLHYFTRNRCDEHTETILNLLISGGADINARNWKSETPLHMAVLLQQLPMVRLLLSRGADPTVPNINGETPIDWARSLENSECVALLQSYIRAGSSSASSPSAGSSSSSSSAAAADASSHTSSHSAQDSQMRGAPFHKSNSMVTVRLDDSVPETATPQDERVLEFRKALREKDVVRIRLLLATDPSLADSVYGPERNTALHHAIAFCGPEIVRTLLWHTSHLAANADGITPLLHAISCGNYEASIAILLSRHDPEATAATVEGNTALHVLAASPLSSSTGNKAEVQERANFLVFALREKGADLEARNAQRQTPLLVATKEKNVPVFTALLEAGADVNATDSPSPSSDSSAQTVLDMVRTNGLIAVPAVSLALTRTASERAAAVLRSQKASIPSQSPQQQPNKLPQTLPQSVSVPSFSLSSDGSPPSFSSPPSASPAASAQMLSISGPLPMSSLIDYPAEDDDDIGTGGGGLGTGDMDLEPEKEEENKEQPPPPPAIQDLDVSDVPPPPIPPSDIDYDDYGESAYMPEQPDPNGTQTDSPYMSEDVQSGYGPGTDGSATGSAPPAMPMMNVSPVEQISYEEQVRMYDPSYSVADDYGV